MREFWTLSMADALVYADVARARYEQSWEQAAFVASIVGNVMGAKPPLTVDKLLGRTSTKRAKGDGAALAAAIDQRVGLPRATVRSDTAPSKRKR